MNDIILHAPMQVQFQLEIRTDDGDAKILQVYQDVSSSQLSKNFVETYDLDEQLVTPLQNYIEQQRTLFLSKQQSAVNDTTLYNSLFNESNGPVSRMDKNEQKTEPNTEQQTKMKEDLLYSKYPQRNLQQYKPQAQQRPKTQDIYTRLHNYSKMRQRRKHEIIEENNRLTIAHTTRITNNHDVYDRNMQYQAKVAEKINQMRQQQAIEQQNKTDHELNVLCTFKPQITKLAQQQIRQKDIYQRNLKNQEAHQFKVNLLQAEMDKECTFKPKLYTTQYNDKLQDRLRIIDMNSFAKRQAQLKQTQHYNTLVQTSNYPTLLIEE